jgi:hypothetical protein
MFEELGSVAGEMRNFGRCGHVELRMLEVF